MCEEVDKVVEAPQARVMRMCVCVHADTAAEE